MPTPAPLSEAARIAAVLGGRKVLGIDIRTSGDLIDAIRAGFPHRVIGDLIARQVFTAPEIERHVIPRRTLAHRKSKRANLTPEESDRLARLARVTALAREVLGDDDKAGRWLRDPVPALDNAVPIDLVDTEAGSRDVEMILMRIAHGIYS